MRKKQVKVKDPQNPHKIFWIEIDEPIQDSIFREDWLYARGTDNDRELIDRIRQLRGTGKEDNELYKEFDKRYFEAAHDTPEEEDDPPPPPPTKRKGSGESPQDPRRRKRVPPPPPLVTPSPKVEVYSIMEDILDNITRQALEPFHTFLGMLSVEVGMSNTLQLYTYGNPDGSAVKRGAKTMPQLISNNRHLGSELLTLFLAPVERSQAKGKTIGECFDNMGAGDNYPLELARLVGPQESLFAPGWVYGVMSSQIFRYLASPKCFGAITIAFNKLRRIPGKEDFTLKELFCSSSVSDMFAMMVGQQYLMTSGGNAYNAQIRGDNSTYYISAGWKHRAALAQKSMGAKMWFENVFRVENPDIPLLKKRLTKIDEKWEEEYGDWPTAEILRRRRVVLQGVYSFDDEFLDRLYLNLFLLRAAESLMPYALKRIE